MTPVDAGDTIDPGRRLIRADPAGAPSLGDRLVHYFERLTWRTPLHDRRLSGRHPLKLLVVPADPVPADPGRAAALAEGVLAAGGEERPLAGFDWAMPGAGRLFVDHMHGFDWLRDLAAVGTRAEVAPVAEAMLAGWLAAHADRVTQPAWRPDLWGRRLMLLTSHAPLVLSSTDLIYRSRVLNTIARGARHLDRTADKTPLGAARVAAWCGVVTAGLLLPGGDARRAVGEAGLARALAASLSGDGGIVTRAPAGLLRLMEHLALLRAVYDARRAEMPEAVTAALGRAGPALLGTAMGDGGLGSWQGGCPSAAAEVQAVMAACGLVSRPLRQSRDWGYQRLSASGAVLVMDAAPPPVVPVEDGGCASTLAFEFSDRAERLIVSCGGAGRAGVRMPAAVAQGLRTTAAHSTLVLADSNSTAIHPDGSLGRGVAEVELARQESDVASRIEASHDGYVRRFGFVHRRQLVLTGDGRELRGEDALLPKGRRPRGGETPFAVRFHLAPGVEAAATTDALAAVLRTPGGAIWQFRAKAGSIAIEDSVWVDPRGRMVATQQIVVSGTAQPGGVVVSWALRRAR